MDKKYREFCESLWTQWQNGDLTLSSAIGSLLDLHFLPEPYVRFGNGKRPLCVLLTNPGRGQRHQRLSAVKKGDHGITTRKSYFDNSLALGEYYRKNLIKGKLARTKLEGMLRFQKLVGADSWRKTVFSVNMRRS